MRAIRHLKRRERYTVCGSLDGSGTQKLTAFFSRKDSSIDNRAVSVRTLEERSGVSDIGLLRRETGSY